MRQIKERKFIFPSWNIREEPDSVKQPPVSQTALVPSVLKLNSTSTIHEINWKVRRVNLNDSLTCYPLIFSSGSCKGIGIPDFGTFLLVGAWRIWNPGLRTPEYSSRNPEFRQRYNPDIQVPLTKNPESSTLNPEFETVLRFILRTEAIKCPVLQSPSWSDSPPKKKRNFVNYNKPYVVALFQMTIFLLAWLASILLYPVSLSVPVAEQLQPFQDVIIDEVDMSDFGKLLSLFFFSLRRIARFPLFHWI